MTLLDVRDVVFAAGPGVTRTISCTLEAGAVVWIRGHSGSGKTSFLRVLARLTRPIDGSVHLQGESWTEIPPVTWRTSVALVPQKPVFFPGSVTDNLLQAFHFQSHRKRNPDLEPARRLFARLRCPADIMERDALTLSGGEGTRVAVVRALLLRPKVLLLDEPTAALDSRSRETMGDVLEEWVAAHSRCIIGVSHDEDIRKRIPGTEIVIGGDEESERSGRTGEDFITPGADR